MNARWTRLLATAVGLAACGGGAPPPQPPTLPAEAAHDTPAPAPPAAPARDYPASRRADVAETLHGVEIHDPYRWLEDATQPEVQAWMKAQDAYAREHLAKLPGRDALAARLAEVFYFDALGPPTHRGDRYFFTHKHKEQEKAILYWKQGGAARGGAARGDTGADKVLLDPNQWSSDGSSSLKGWWPSSDGRYLAYNKSEHNADETTMSVIEVATGKPLKETLPGTKYGGASWTPDGRGFYYEYVPPVGGEVTIADRPGFAEVRYHALGSDPASDPVVREATHDAKTFIGGRVSRDGHWLFADVRHGWNSTDVYFRDLRARQKGWTVLAEGIKANFEVDDHRDVFYVRTDDGAPRNRVFAVDPKKPARAAWKEIVPEDDATLEELQVLGGQLVLRYLRNAASEVQIHDLKGKRVRALDLPPLGNVGRMVGLPTDDAAYASYTSFTVPQTIYKLSIKSGAVAEWAKVELPI
ncbi:MAG TPA: hypothetical protein VLM79_22965, partial [Kofleriaceae bacterium]|nr:hypothetical protein [Kofleriaceae bacterium]